MAQVDVRTRAEAADVLQKLLDAKLITSLTGSPAIDTENYFKFSVCISSTTRTTPHPHHTIYHLHPSTSAHPSTSSPPSHYLHPPTPSLLSHTTHATTPSHTHITPTQADTRSGMESEPSIRTIFTNNK
jgi:hypothetical protein